MRPTLLVLALCTLAACSPSEAPARAKNPLLVIGWDGATFDLIDPLIAAGRLPNLSRLIADGASARLQSTIIPISSAAWVAAVTGKGPGQTGVYSFFEPIDGSYEVRLIDARSNRATPIWRALTRQGLRANVIGVPVSWPPEPVDGTFVSGMLSPFDSVYAWPAQITDELRERGFVPDLGIWREQQPLTGEFIERQLALKEAFVIERMQRSTWDFTLVVFKSLDVLSHRAFSLRLDGPVAELLERLDAILGRLLEAAGPHANTIVLSDHGFARYRHAFNLHTWLVESGFGELLGDRPPAQPVAGPLARARAQAHGERMARFDHARTRAYATACEGNYGSIRLNLRGREPEGAVEPERRAELVAELRLALERIPTPGAGRTPLVTRVFDALELYPGPHRDALPDLMIEVRPDVQVVCNAFTAQQFENEPPAPDHARTGILVLAGPDVRPNDRRGDAQIVDLAPTALHLLDQPVFSEMEGRVLAEFVAGSPVRVREADVAIVRELDRRADAPQRPDADVRDRLQALGYTD